jgi:nicotinate-nucleotide pyrophosphorylase (carboxylating)
MVVSKSEYGYWSRAETLIRLALEEDLPARDITTEAVLPPGVRASAVIVAKEDLTVSGLGIARRVFEIVDPEVKWQSNFDDSETAVAGDVLAGVEGTAASLMAAERTALNFLQHLSGIATTTQKIVAKVKGLPVTILDTRKTLPGWRLLEKAAVLHGGGTNHRFSLSDSILIKDNHIKLCSGVAKAVERARAALPLRTRIEVETTSASELEEALEAGADVVLVDNTTPADLARAVAAVGGRAAVEVSGGITTENVAAMARTGVSMISLGALTHSSRAVDISLKVL